MAEAILLVSRAAYCIAQVCAEPFEVSQYQNPESSIHSEVIETRTSYTFKMVSGNWVEIRAAMGGQPTLVEDRSAFAALDSLRFHPRVIAAIGGRLKREIFDDNYAGSGSPVQGVRILPWPKSQLLMDCELHECVALSTLNVLPPSGSRRQRPLNAVVPTQFHSHQALLRLSFNFYWQVILPFTPLAFLFLDDIGDDDLVIELLADWVKKSVLSPASSPPRLIIVHENQNTAIQDFLSQLRLRLAAFVPPTPEPSSRFEADTSLRCETAFERIEFLPAAAVSQGLIDIYVEEAFGYREKAGFAFSNEHLKYLLENAVDFFCAGHGRQLDLYDTARLANPSHKSLRSHIAHFMDITSGLAISHEEVIASALDFDAHPPRMHYFQPSHEFDKFYLTTVSQLDKFKIPGRFTTRIRHRYIELASERRGGSSARSHIDLLAQFKTSWRNCYSQKTCLVCLAQFPSSHLSCGHVLCDQCVVICGTASTDCSWDLEVRLCPLCKKINNTSMSLRPPTAGMRIMAIESSLASKLATWQFLRDLQFYIGMPLPIHKHFDVVFGSGVGSFFALTLFSERWDLGDCKYHMKSLAEPAVAKNSSIVSFGKRLMWNMDEAFRSNGALTCLQILGQTYSNFSPQPTENQAEDLKRSGDIYIQFSSEACPAGLMRAAAARLIACLFYIELLSEPTFYATPEYARLLLRCRLTERQQLLCLLKGLHRLRIQVYHRGDDEQTTSELLVTPELLSACREGKPFFKQLRLKVNGFHTRLDVKIDGIAGEKESISNCPYQLGKLVKDQGLDQVFGSKDHRISTKPPDPEHDAVKDLANARDTLDNIIVSYSKLTEPIYSADGNHPALETPRSLSWARREAVAGKRDSRWI